MYCQYVLKMQVLGNKWFKNKTIKRMSLSGLLLGSMYSIIPESFHNIEGLQKIIVNESSSFTLAISIFLVYFLLLAWQLPQELQVVYFIQCLP